MTSLGRPSTSPGWITALLPFAGDLSPGLAAMTVFATGSAAIWLLAAGASLTALRRRG